MRTNYVYQSVLYLVRKYGFPLYRYLTFPPEKFRHRHFITRTFRHMHVLLLQAFWLMDFLAPWTFQLRHISAHGHFVTLAQVPKCRCQNVCSKMYILLCEMPKHPSTKISLAEISMVPKIPCIKLYPC